MFSLPDIVAGVILIALTAYVLFGGADFGGGVWDLFASGPRRDAQRELIVHAIGPIWEANHVWLILVVVLLFTCFPAVFASLAIALHVPLSLLLIGIVLRGSAFTFRAYGGEADPVVLAWGRVFAVSSLITPILLGVCIGAIASGRLGVTPRNDFMTAFVLPWLTPFALSTGILALTLFAYLAATYLAVEAAGQTALQADFRTRALLTAAAVFAAAFLTLALAPQGSAPIPRIEMGLVAASWTTLLHAATAVAAVAGVWALWTRRFRLARAAAAGQVSLILWGWAAAQYPYLLPPRHTIEGSAAPAVTLELVMIGVAGGFAVLVPSLVYLFRVFKSDTFARPE